MIKSHLLYRLSYGRIPPERKRSITIMRGVGNSSVGVQEMEEIFWKGSRGGALEFGAIHLGGDVAGFF